MSSPVCLPYTLLCQGAMAQCCAALKPDGLFLAAMFGGETLQELRVACAAAQMEREGGVSAAVSPLAQVRDCGNLLTRAGFALPAVDVDTFQIHYGSPPEVVTHLRAMGESNGVAERQRVLPRDTALASAAVMHTMFAQQGGRGEGEQPADAAGATSAPPPPPSAAARRDSSSPQPSIPVSYQVLYMTGWSPAPTQQRAAARGSATVSLEQLAEVLEKGPPPPHQRGASTTAAQAAPPADV